ncbi:MAG: hypothetical protein Q3961_00655 [Bifidobacteriaceae bacterium]|nr:hypothetical protein [Bifidobacteriaceae bacterium]
MNINAVNKKRIILWVAVIIVSALFAYSAIADLHPSTQTEAKGFTVPLVVNAKGLNVKKGTKIPVRAKGKETKSQKPVDTTFYAASDTGIDLQPGSYTLTIVASPIAEDGTLYDVQNATTKVDISEDGKADIEHELTIDPIPAQDVTDEQIDEAYKAAKNGDEDVDKLNDLKLKIIRNRVKATTDENSEYYWSHANNSPNTMEVTGKHFYETPYFYIDVPAWWDPDNWKAKQDSDVSWTVSYIFVRNEYYTLGAAISFFVSKTKEDPWPDNVSPTVYIGETSDGQYVFAGYDAAATILSHLTITPK